MLVHIKVTIYSISWCLLHPGPKSTDGSTDVLLKWQHLSGVCPVTSKKASFPISYLPFTYHFPFCHNRVVFMFQAMQNWSCRSSSNQIEWMGKWKQHNGVFVERYSWHDLWTSYTKTQLGSWNFNNCWLIFTKSSDWKKPFMPNYCLEQWKWQSYSSMS